jgi:hypothetical protein
VPVEPPTSGDQPVCAPGQEASQGPACNPVRMPPDASPLNRVKVGGRLLTPTTLDMLLALPGDLSSRSPGRCLAASVLPTLSFSVALIPDICKIYAVCHILPGKGFLWMAWVSTG